MVYLCRGEGQTGADILLLKIRKIAQHFGLAHTGGKKIENVLHPNTHTADARATPALIRIEGDAIHGTEPNSHAEGSKGSARFPSASRWPSRGCTRAPRRRIRAALEHLAPEPLIPAPDCGMKYIPRATAFAKLKALAEGAAIVRRELRGS